MKRTLLFAMILVLQGTCVDALNIVSNHDNNESRGLVHHAIINNKRFNGKLGNVGENDLYIELRNFGSEPLYAARIEWTIDGIYQEPFEWRGSLAAVTGVSPHFVMGRVTLAEGVPIVVEVWATLLNEEFPNENEPESDRRPIELQTGLLPGVYQVGGMVPDFPSVAAAAYALGNFGIRGDVTFNVHNDNTQSTFDIFEIPRSDKDNSITIRSASGIPSSVVLAPFRITDGNVTFENVTFGGSAEFFFFSVYLLSRTSAENDTIQNVTFNGCQFVGLGASEGQLAIGQGAASWLQDFTIKNCSFSNYSRTFTLSTIGQADSIYNNVFRGNKEGINVYTAGNGSLLVANNLVEGSNVTIGGYKVVARLNKIINGKFMLHGKHHQIENNIIVSANSVLNSYADSISVSHNSFFAGFERLEDVTAIILEGDMTSVEFYNNLVVNYGGPIYNAISDKRRFPATKAGFRNNIYHWDKEDSAFARGVWNDVIDLRSWHRITGLDSISFAIDPGPVTLNDLRPTNIQLIGKGTPSALKVDFDGMPRHALVPTPGAFEIEAPTFSAISVLQRTEIDPCSQKINPEFLIYNSGTSVVDAVDVFLTINQFVQSTRTWTGTLPPGHSVAIPIDYNFEMDSAYMVNISASLHGVNETDDDNEASWNILSYTPISLGDDKVFCDQLDTHFELTAPFNFRSYQWGPISFFDPVQPIFASGEYWLSVVDYNGCVSTDTVKVKMTSFSPRLEKTAPGLCLENPTQDFVGLETSIEGIADAPTYRWFLDGEEIPGFEKDLAVDYAGKFHAVVTISGCSIETNTQEVIAYPTPAKPIISVSTYDGCEGETISLTVTEPAYHYAWWPYINGAFSRVARTDTTATVKVTVTNSYYCESTSDEVMVTVHEKPTASIIFAQGILIASPGSGWQWFLNGQPIAEANQQLYVPETNGTYTVEVLSPFCSSISIPFELLITDLIEPFERFKIYPNPVGNHLIIRQNSSSAPSFVLTDTFGNKLNPPFDVAADGNLVIDTSLIANGFYLITLKSTDGYRWTEKVIVHH